MSRRRKKDEGLLEIAWEASEMLFAHVPTGWSVLVALGLMALVGSQAVKVTLPIVPAVMFVLLGVLPAFVVVMAAYKAARTGGRAFWSFFSLGKFDDGVRDDTGGVPLERVMSRPTPRPVASVSPTRNAPVAETPESPEWSLPLLKEMDWKRFEFLVSGLFNLKGWRAENVPAGPDGGIDVRLYAPGALTPTALIQCKAWREKQVGVAVVRELYGVMAAEKVDHGMLFSCGEFSTEAQRFAEDKSIDLVDGNKVLELIAELTPEQSRELHRAVTVGDYKTPTCPSCGVKMVKRQGPQKSFWGCVNYPGCRSKIWIG